MVLAGCVFTHTHTHMCVHTYMHGCVHKYTRHTRHLYIRLLHVTTYYTINNSYTHTRTHAHCVAAPRRHPLSPRRSDALPVDQPPASSQGKSGARLAALRPPSVPAAGFPPPDTPHRAFSLPPSQERESRRALVGSAQSSAAEPPLRRGTKSRSSWQGPIAHYRTKTEQKQPKKTNQAAGKKKKTTLGDLLPP